MPQAFTSITSPAAPLMQANVDTDTIMPSREMRQVSKTGLKDGLFANWRYLTAAERVPNPDFVLNQPAYKQAQMLLVGDNFGCGSSREFAVWALAEYGIRVIIAPSFGSIFFANCIRNGLLPIVLAQADIDSLAAPMPSPVTVDLQTQMISLGENENENKKFAFTIDETYRNMLLNGLDEIGLTEKNRAHITDFITADQARRPWIYKQHKQET